MILLLVGKYLKKNNKRHVGRPLTEWKTARLCVRELSTVVFKTTFCRIPKSEMFSGQRFLYAEYYLRLLNRPENKKNNNK